MKKLIPKILAVLVVALIGGWFYWFQYLPYQANQEKLRVEKEEVEFRRKLVTDCNAKAIKTATLLIDVNIAKIKVGLPFQSYGENYDNEYSNCIQKGLREKGLDK